MYICSNIIICASCGFDLSGVTRLPVTVGVYPATKVIDNPISRDYFGNMPKHYPGLRDILSSPSGRVICLADLGNFLAYYLDKTTLLYKYCPLQYIILHSQAHAIIYTARDNIRLILFSFRSCLDLYIFIYLFIYALHKYKSIFSDFPTHLCHCLSFCPLTIVLSVPL